jgi:hypothetical protein
MPERRSRTFLVNGEAITVRAERVHQHWFAPVTASRLGSDGTRQVLDVHGAKFASWATAHHAGLEFARVRFGRC